MLEFIIGFTAVTVIVILGGLAMRYVEVFLSLILVAGLVTLSYAVGEMILLKISGG